VRKRAAIYARSATTQEHEPNFQLASQIHECKEYAVSKGYEVVEEYQEVSSGATIERPILKSLFEAAKEGKFDVLLIRDFARLARNSVLIHDLIRLFDEMGIEVESAIEPKDVIDLAAAIFGGVERIRKELVARRMQAGKAAKRNLQN
jgi:site-specific DNA recombinase